MGLKEDLSNVKMWKTTTMKRHDGYVCMPRIGTPWVNKLTEVSGVTSSSERFVLSDAYGDKMGISASSLANNYKFSTGEPITIDTLKTKMEKDLIDWTKVEAKPGTNMWAFHLNSQKYGNTCRNFQVKTPRGLVLANKTGVNHGVGDFLVCEDRNGRPDIGTLQVVNGKLFVVSYDMRAFPGIVDGGATLINAPKPASIFTPAQREMLDKQKKEVSKKELAKQLEQCYDTLGLVSSTILLVYFGVFISKLPANNVGFTLLKNTHLEGNTLSTNMGGNVAACGTSVLRFDTGNKLFVRTAISTNNQMVCNMQFIDAKGAVLNSTISNNSELCIDYLFFVKKYRENVESLIKAASLDLDKGGLNLVNYAKKMAQSSDKNTMDSFLKGGHSSFIKYLTVEMTDRKGGK